jgi:hypothetical protein
MKPSELLEKLNAAKEVLEPFVFIADAAHAVQFYMNAGKWLMKQISSPDTSHLWCVKADPKWHQHAPFSQYYYFESQAEAQAFVDFNESQNVLMWFTIQEPTE